MDKLTYIRMNEQELQQAIDLLQSRFPQLTGREVRLRSILTPLVAHIASNTRAYELLGIRTAAEMAEQWDVSVRRAQAFIAAQHERWGAGRRIGNMWCLSADEAERIKPAAGGRPKKEELWKNKEDNQ